MKITYTERNGRRYAYLCTSKRVPGKKNPVSKREYLGTVDPETGMIVPKKVSAELSSMPIRDGIFRMRTYGDALIACKIADDLDLRADLEHAIGEFGGMALAMSVAETIVPSSAYDIRTLLEDTSVMEVLGVDRGRLRERMSETLEAIDGGSVDRFFAARTARCADGTMLCEKTVRIFDFDSTLNGTLEANDDLNIGDVNLEIVSDMHGIPVSYGFNSSFQVRSSASDTGIPGSDGIRLTAVITDFYSNHPSILMDMLSKGMRFAASCDISSKPIGSLVTEFVNGSKGPDGTMQVAGVDFSFRERILGVAPTSNGWIYVTEDDPRFDNCSVKFRAFVCRDPVLNEFTARSIDDSVAGVRSELDGRIFDDPQEAFERGASAVRRYLEYSLDAEGRMSIITKDSRVMSIKARAGVFVMLTSGMGFGEVIRLFRTRKAMFLQMSGFMDEMTRRWGTDSRLMRGRLLIHMIAAMIRTEISNRIDDVQGLTVDGVLRIASTYCTVSIGDCRFTSAVSRRLASVLELFGITVPSDMTED